MEEEYYRFIRMKNRGYYYESISFFYNPFSYIFYSSNANEMGSRSRTDHHLHCHSFVSYSFSESLFTVAIIRDY